MLRSSQVLTIPPPSTSSVIPPSPGELSSSPTKSKFGKDKEKKAGKEKDKFRTENYSNASPTKHAPNPFRFNQNGGNSGKTTPKKGGLRRTQSSGSLDDSPKGTPYSQMPPGGGSPYNLKLGTGQEQALQFMFPSLDKDPFSRSDSPPLMPPPNLALLQNGFVGHVRGSSFDSGTGQTAHLGSQSTLYLHGNGSSGAGTSRGSASGGSGNRTNSWVGTGSSAGHGIGMGLGNHSRPRVGSGSHGQAILIKDRAARDKENEDKFNALKERERDWTPGKFSTMLSQTKSTELEVPKLKKLRIMLRNEAAS
jgi:hypothetical protein